jgi:hypothetical protein
MDNISVPYTFELVLKNNAVFCTNTIEDSEQTSPHVLHALVGTKRQPVVLHAPPQDFDTIAWEA